MTSAPTIEKRRLGGTDMDVSVLGFGGAEIGFGPASHDLVSKLLNAALDAGLNVIDTAECYGEGETKIGETVGHRRSEFFLFTKCGHSSGIDLPDWSPDLLKKSIDRSLQRLKTDRVDLLQLHSCSKEILAKGEVVEFLQEARAAGKTRYIGYSGDGEDAVYAVKLGVFDTLQTSINVADQQVLEMALPLAREQNMGVIAKRPIANVAWGTAEPRNSYQKPYWERLQNLAYSWLVKPTPEAVAIALRFTLSQPGVHTAIVGTENPDRWAKNAALLEAGPLSHAEIDEIRARWAEASQPDWVGQI
jgi:aryl-alcohol dehydrogenase-like predicted oxidoreductase